jgi:prohibitin 2
VRNALRYLREQRSKYVLLALVLVSVFVFLLPFIVIVVPAGKAGAVFQPLMGGTNTNRPLREGLNFILPWNQVTLYEIRVKSVAVQFEAITKDGLAIRLGVIYRYRLHASTIGRLHKLMGPQYEKIMLNPSINAIVRAETSGYTSEQIYGDRRRELQALIYAGVVADGNYNLIERGSDPHDKDEILMANISDRPPGRKGHKYVPKASDYVPLVELVDVQITEVKLPNIVRQAIERKEEQQQIQKEYIYRIEREKLESERKRIEAEGIRAFQETVQAGISDTYLRWRGIEATEKLATSPNSKVVIIGSGRTGMPLILNTDDGRPAAEPARAKPKSAKPR